MYYPNSIKPSFLKCYQISKNQILVRPPAPARNLSGIESSHIKKKKGASVKILCVARIHPRKGRTVCLKQSEHCLLKKSKILNVHLSVQLLQRIFLKIFKKNDQKICKVSFYGDLSDKELNIHYQNSDFLALTSMPRNKSVEGFGIVCAEASSYGLPVLAHRIEEWRMQFYMDKPAF